MNATPLKGAKGAVSPAEIAKGVGKSLTEFKKGVKEAQSEVTTAAKDIDEASEPKQEEIKEEKMDHID